MVENETLLQNSTQVWKGFIFFISGSNQLRYGLRIPFTTKIGKNQDWMHIKFSTFLSFLLKVYEMQIV